MSPATWTSGPHRGRALMVSSRYRYSRPENPTYIAYQADQDKLFAMLCRYLAR